MSLLDTLPHECSIRRRVRAKDSVGGSTDSFTTEQTAVECWEQQAGAAEVTEYAKRGQVVTRKVYFKTDPAVTERHQILVTKRNGTAVSSPVALNVVSVPAPDVAAGLGLLFRVMCSEHSGEDD